MLFKLFAYKESVGNDKMGEISKYKLFYIKRPSSAK